jgi:hypothetical protein
MGQEQSFVKGDDWEEIEDEPFTTCHTCEENKAVTKYRKSITLSPSPFWTIIVYSCAPCMNSILNDESNNGKIWRCKSE